MMMEDEDESMEYQHGETQLNTFHQLPSPQLSQPPFPFPPSQASSSQSLGDRSLVKQRQKRSGAGFSSGTNRLFRGMFSSGTGSISGAGGGASGGAQLSAALNAGMSMRESGYTGEVVVHQDFFHGKNVCILDESMPMCE